MIESPPQPPELDDIEVRFNDVFIAQHGEDYRHFIEEHGAKAFYDHKDPGKPDCYLDSLDKVEMVMALEEEFNIEISEAAFLHVETIGEALTALRKALG